MRLDELIDALRTCCWLEEIGLTESIERGDEAWEDRIVLAHYRLSRLLRGNTERAAAMARLGQRHVDYHRALISACGSPPLIDYCSELHQQTVRYRNLAPHMLRDGPDDALALRDAVLGRDGDLAVELLRKCFRATLEAWLTGEPIH